MKLPFAKCVLKAQPTGSITQYFAENPALYSRFGLKGHSGIDLVAPHGTPMVAVESGTVINVKNDPEGYGKHVRILSTKSYNGLYREWTYGHCNTISVKVGDKVKEGDVIATMGNTGFVVSGSTPYWKFNPYAGTHVHLSCRYVKKTAKGWAYEGSGIKIEVQDYQNGYRGAVDPLTFFDVATTPDIANLEAQVSLLTKVLELLKLKKSL